MNADKWLDGISVDSSGAAAPEVVWFQGFFREDGRWSWKCWSKAECCWVTFKPPRNTTVFASISILRNGIWRTLRVQHDDKLLWWVRGDTFAEHSHATWRLLSQKFQTYERSLSELSLACLGMNSIGLVVLRVGKASKPRLELIFIPQVVDVGLLGSFQSWEGRQPLCCLHSLTDAGNTVCEYVSSYAEAILTRTCSVFTGNIDYVNCSQSDYTNRSLHGNECVFMNGMFN